MKHTQYDIPGIILPRNEETHNPAQYELKFPHPGQYRIEFPNESELKSDRPKELPPSNLEARF